MFTETGSQEPYYPQTLKELEDACLQRRILAENVGYAPGLKLVGGTINPRGPINAVFGLEIVKYNINMCIVII